MSRINLMPGDVKASADPEVVLSTLLGSCVAACLYDPVAGVFGMNHFLLASQGRAQAGVTSETGRYGVHAMELLINALLKRGAERCRLQAKVFGGANVLTASGPGHYAVGETNAHFVQAFLENEGIPLIASDLGGYHGRQIHFHGNSFAVYVKLLKGTQEREVAADEAKYLGKKLSEQKQVDKGSVTFFDD